VKQQLLTASMISFSLIGKSKRGPSKKKSINKSRITGLKSAGAKEKYTNQGSQKVEILNHRKALNTLNNGLY